MKNFKVNNKNKKIKKIIFLSEPVIGKVKKYYDERKCLSFFLKNIHLLKLKFSKISIRPHPGEKKSKFEWIKKYSNRIVISNKKHIFNDILENDIIVGINTVALVLGVMAKKKVISCIPTNKVKCYLPHKKILDFKKIIYEKN